MGREVFTRDTYRKVMASERVAAVGSTARAEQQARITGKLDPLVDPAGFGVIRLSLPRVEKKKVGGKELWELLVGTPMPVETRVDTTGSMGDNVDVAIRVLPNAFESWGNLLKGYDIQVATGIFGDVQDQFVLCRPQFEMEALKIVKQLTLMAPQRAGGDTPEDPDLGIFGGAYLCRHYINRIGLKGYDFTVTDAPGRGKIDPKVVKRVYGDEAFDKVKENGHKVNSRSAIELNDVWNDLLDRAHAFVLQVNNSYQTTEFWTACVGESRLVKLPSTEFLPQVQGAIIGLTEGTLELSAVQDFLRECNMSKSDASKVADSLCNIPIGAQAALPNFGKIPQQGDLFEGKPDVWEDTNLWPVDNVEPPADEEDEWTK